jgi:16S rRNA (guanine527-N7)-methyltransferase
MTEALRAGIERLRLSLDQAGEDKLLAYLSLLDKWNRTHNLTAIRDCGHMITHHLLDSLAVVPYLPGHAGLRVADIGSGGGLPGIPLAVARPDWRVTLIDSNQKKIAFLNQAVIELPLPNVNVVAARVEKLPAASQFDVIIARAYSTLSTFVAQTRHLLALGGRCVAMKGSIPDDEMKDLPAGLSVEAVHSLHVPGIAAERHLVIMKAASP